jgi:hypothetical protein
MPSLHQVLLLSLFCSILTAKQYFHSSASPKTGVLSLSLSVGLRGPHSCPQGNRWYDRPIDASPFNSSYLTPKRVVLGRLGFRVSH